LKQWGSKLLKQFEKIQRLVLLVLLVLSTYQVMVDGGKPKKMYGRVKHTNEGKTWLSAYSNDGQELESVVSVDGLFFAVDKTKIATNFNEEVEGSIFMM
jgi:hypothetical protein